MDSRINVENDDDHRVNMLLDIFMVYKRWLEDRGSDFRWIIYLVPGTGSFSLIAKCLTR